MASQQTRAPRGAPPAGSPASPAVITGPPPDFRRDFLPVPGESNPTLRSLFLSGCGGVCVWRGGLAATPSVAPARKVSTNIWTISAESTTAYKTFELQRNEAHPWLFLQKGDVDTFFARFYTTPHALVGGYMTYYKNITPCWSIQRPQRLVVLYLHVLGH